MSDNHRAAGRAVSDNSRSRRSHPPSTAADTCPAELATPCAAATSPPPAASPRRRTPPPSRCVARRGLMRRRRWRDAAWLLGPIAARDAGRGDEAAAVAQPRRAADAPPGGLRAARRPARDRRDFGIAADAERPADDPLPAGPTARPSASPPAPTRSRPAPSALAQLQPAARQRRVGRPVRPRRRLPAAAARAEPAARCSWTCSRRCSCSSPSRRCCCTC